MTEHAEVTIRLTFRRPTDGQRLRPDAVATLDVPLAGLDKIAEVAVEAIRARAEGFRGPAAHLARARVAVRDLARRPEIKRSVAVAVALLRQGADKVEREAAEAAARIVHDYTPPSE